MRIAWKSLSFQVWNSSIFSKEKDGRLPSAVASIGIWKSAARVYEKLVSAVPIPDPDRRRSYEASQAGELKTPIRAIDYISSVREYREVSDRHFVAI
ncbi:hypothetical protein AAIB41_16700 [Brucella sp. BE17]|uniref:hypothetical protein n=1 Tax=Brucella sp. BE17 TaxID=3142977 RepID=UPI0031BA8BE9